jgi:hypothetical protein
VGVLLTIASSGLFALPVLLVWVVMYPIYWFFRDPICPVCRSKDWGTELRKKSRTSRK